MVLFKYGFRSFIIFILPFLPDFGFILLFLLIFLSCFVGVVFQVQVSSGGVALKCRVSDQLDRRADSADRYPLKHRP